jgi:1,4-alpha-glucan branching enzyme
VIHKRYFESIDAIEVTFELDRPDAHDAAVAIDALGWVAVPMRRYPAGSGPLKAKVRLPAGRDIHFRYLVDGAEWCNDPHADDTRANGFGGENSVLVHGVG